MSAEIWVAIRPDSNGAYTGTEAEMRAKIASELKARPALPWLLGKMTSIFSSKVLPPEEIKL